MFTRAVSVVYLLSTLIVWLKLFYLTTENWIGHTLVLITLVSTIVQELHQIRKYDAVSRSFASSGLVDGVILVPLLLASLFPLLESRLEKKFSIYTDLYWISLLNSLHFLINGVTNARISPYPSPLTLVMDVIISFAISYISDIAFALFKLGIALIWFNTMNHILLTRIQKSFTMGEAAILSNAITLLSYIVWHLSIGNTVSDIKGQQNVILLGLILGSVLICLCTFPTLYSAKSNTVIRKNPVYFYGCLLVVIFGIVAPWVAYINGEYPVTWIFKYMVTNLSNISLVIYWILCLLILLPVIGYIQQYGAPLIMIRKCFHLLGLIMFVPATATAPHFLSVGYAIAFAALLIIEIIKYGTVPPLSRWLTRLMRRFEDPRDGGYFTVTHLYLLVGCAAPLWIMSAVGLEDSDLVSLPSSYAGLLILGVGDSAAAVIGTHYGRHKWFWPSGSSRSFEGSIASVLSVLASFFILSILFDISVNWIGVLIAVGLSSALEAVTDQIDNIVLPLLFMALLNVNGV